VRTGVSQAGKLGVKFRRGLSNPTTNKPLVDDGKVVTIYIYIYMLQLLPK